MTSLNTLRPLDHQCLPDPDDWHRIVSKLPRGSLTTGCSSGLSDPPPVPGTHPFTWCPRGLPVTSGPVVTTVHSTTKQYQTITLSPIHDFSVPLFSLSWIRSCQPPDSSAPPPDVPMTAVITPFGLFQFVRMPFGLQNAAQMFKRFMDQVLRFVSSAYAYINDFFVASSTPEQHIKK